MEQDMHELGITEQIVKIATKHGEKNQAEKITDLYLVIGELSSVIDNSVQFYWDMIAEDTICEGATLHFKRIPAVFKCQACSQEFQLQNGSLAPCPGCQSSQMEIIQGNEFYLESINIL
jgi:hydrogenase nickel incorporation protein HypA/HybF